MSHIPRRFRTALLMVAAAAASAGCYAHHGAGWVQPAPVSVDVVNHNTLDINVYTVHSGMRIRLGTVNGLTNGHFQVQANQFGDGSLQLYASPIGGARGYLSETVYVTPGLIVTWTLEQVLSQSALVVRDTTS